MIESLEQRMKLCSNSLLNYSLSQVTESGWIQLNQCGPQGSTWNRTQDHYEAFTSKSRLQIWDFKRGYCSIHRFTKSTPLLGAGKHMCGGTAYVNCHLFDWYQHLMFAKQRDTTKTFFFFFSQLYFSGNGMITVIKSIHVKCYAMYRSWDHTNHNLLANLNESLDFI